MKTRAAACPSCGGPVEFRISTSMVTVCPFCNCVVARGDKSVKDHGRVADLIETWSPVALGSTGAFHHKRFEVIGRVQYRHPAGGVWDEWYLSFSNGLMGWLAEAQGKQYLTFEKKLKSDISLPAHDALTPGQQIVLGRHGAFTVGEVGVATTSSAQGEIPWSFVPDRPHRFVDLYTEKGGFARLAFGTTPVRIGQASTLTVTVTTRGRTVLGCGCGIDRRPESSYHRVSENVITVVRATVTSPGSSGYNSRRSNAAPITPSTDGAARGKDSRLFPWRRQKAPARHPPPRPRLRDPHRRSPW